MTEIKRGRATINISLGMFQPAKGLLMFVIILWHTISSFNNFSEVPFYQLHPMIAVPKFILDFFFNYTVIPVFFMMCGFSFRRRPLRYLIKGTPLYILKAYLFTSLIIICAKTLNAAIMGQEVFLKLISQLFNYMLMVYPGAMWFLCVLALNTIILNYVLTLKSRLSQIAVCLLLACIGMLLKDIRLPFQIQQTYIRLPFQISQICICLSFMYIGYLMNEKKVLTKKFPWYILVLFLLLNLFLFVRGNNHISVGSNLYPNGMVDLIIAWLGGYVFMFGAAFLGQFNGRFFDLLVWMGQYSFLICCVHHVERECVPLQQAVSLVIRDDVLQFYTVFVLRVILCLALTYVILAYQKRKRLRT